MIATKAELGLVVINPNSTRAVTAAMDRALEALRQTDGVPIRCVTLAEGPPGIETDQHIDDVIAPLVSLIRSLDSDALGFVNACFSDPGLAALRQATDKPVLGIAECAYRYAAANHRRFGVISILEASVVRHRRYIEALGLDEQLAGDRAINRGVTALGENAEATLSGLVQVGEALRDKDKAEVVILGCAGMAAYRDQLEASLAIPVIDPVMQAAKAAMAAVRR